MSGKKSPNFTEIEKETLTDILNCNGRKEIIEDKHNNGKMIIKKENTWDEVVSAFNSCHGVNIRTKKQLKDAWKNMKSRLKAQAAAVKRDVRATGGGSSQTTGLDPISEKVLAMVPEQIYSLHNPYDDDATFHEEQVMYPWKLTRGLTNRLNSLFNSLDASGQYSIHICHGIALELRPYGAILMKFQDIFSDLQKKQHKNILINRRLLQFLNYL